MSEKRVFSIVGTGAVGGYYGSLLQRAGHEVHFLLNRDFAHVAIHGLTIESCHGDFVLPQVNVYSDVAAMPKSDVIIVALKSTANHVLPQILPYLVKEDSVVVTLQNGLGSEEAIAATVGPDKVMGGLCFLCANKTGPGHIRHLDYGLITLGEYSASDTPGGITARLKQVGEDFEQSRIPIQLVEDLALARWKKLVWNIPFNGLSVLHDALTDELISDPETRLLCETLMMEVVAAAAVCARPIEQSFIHKMMENTQKMKPYAPSMKLDYERGNPMEIESIYGNPIRAAKAKGVSMPETENIYHQLLSINPAI